MNEQAALHIDRCVENYLRDCRERIPLFLGNHFSLAQTWDLQRHTLVRDIPLGVINALWAIPYLTLRKGLEILEKVGFAWAGQLILKIPSGIRSDYQRKIERLIAGEILEWDLTGRSALPDPLVKSLLQDPAVARLADHNPAVFSEYRVPQVRRLIDKFCEGRALVTDLSGTLFTMFCGWYFFGRSSLSLHEMGTRFARRKAYDEASSGFFLGRGIGNTFYDIFPPGVQERDVQFYLILLGLGFVAATVLFTLLSDPLRQTFDGHRARLNVLIDDLERELLLQLHHKLKRRLL